MSAPNPMLVHLDHNFYTAMLRSSAFLPPAVKNLLALAKFFVEELLHWLTVPVEVYLRRHFGVRALTVYPVAQLALASLTYGVFLHGLQRNPPLAGFLIGAEILAAYHFIEARLYEKSGQPWRHTYANGTPYGFWESVASTDNVLRFGEPLLCLIAGGLALLFNKPLGYFLLASAAALALKAHLRHLRYVDAIRDKHDAGVLGQILAETGTNAASDRVIFVVRPSEFRDELRTPEQETEADGTVESAPLVPPAPTIPTVSLRCNQCGRRLRVKEKHRGRVFPCPECAAPVKVEAAPAAA